MSEHQPPPEEPPTEVEIKLTLAAAEDYRRLQEHLPGPGRAREQENVFFDTAARALRAAGWALRVRRSGERVLVTVKGSGQAVDAAVGRVEWEGEIPARSWEAIAAGELAPEVLASAPVEALRRRGVGLSALPLQRMVAFRNHRTSYRVQLGGAERILELDRTEFPGGVVEHEVEVEIEEREERAALPAIVSRVHADLAALLQSLGVSARAQPLSKLARALRYQGERR